MMMLSISRDPFLQIYLTDLLDDEDPEVEVCMS